jgi:CRISPR-associated protein Csd1
MAERGGKGMILQSLARYYQRLIECGAEGIAPYGYSPEKISFEIVLAEDGSVVQVNPLWGDTSGKKPQPRTIEVPTSFKRPGKGSKSFFLWDKTSYALGVGKKEDRTVQDHAAFKRLHLESLEGVEDVGLKALLAFLRSWTPAQFANHPEFVRNRDAMLDTNIVFRFEDERAWLHERPTARAIWGKLFKSDHDTRQGMCLVTGERTTLERLHPPIKGFTSTGVSIVSFNADAYLSYKGSLEKVRSNKKENDSGVNAPVSSYAAFAYTTVLSHLLRRSEDNRQRLQIGDTTVVFWAEAEDGNTSVAEKAEGFLAAVLNPPVDDDSEVQQIRYVLDGIAQCRPLEELDPDLAPGTHMFVLGLTPNKARLSIRFWYVDTLDVMIKRLAKHREDLCLDPSPWKTEPSVRRLALAAAPSRWSEQKKHYEHDSKNIPPQLIGELMRAILNGTRYPLSLLANIIMRMRADGDISGVRVAICKAVLVRNLRIQHSQEHSKEVIPVSLNLTETNRGYLLGRLFYYFEHAQRRALGSVNAGVKDKYYGAASATPFLVFPFLIHNFNNHIAKLRRGVDRDKGAAVAIERSAAEIIDMLRPPFPSHLSIEDQGYFAIGYYHQSQAYFARRAAESGEDTSPDSETTDSPTQGVLL